LNQKSQFFIIFLLGFSISLLSDIRSLSANCARKIASLNRQMNEHQDETRGARDLEIIYDKITFLRDPQPQVERLIALANAVRFYALFGEDPHRLRSLRDDTLREEDRLLQSAKGWARRDQISFLETLSEFNLSFYKIFSLEEAEAFYADLKDSTAELVLNGGKKNLFQQVVDQYEIVFAPAFPMPVAEVLSPLQTQKRIDLLQYELESIDLDISNRARWFLSLVYAHLSYRARSGTHINRDAAIDLFSDQAIRQVDAHRDGRMVVSDPLRNAHPNGSLQGKKLNYTSGHEHEEDQARLLAENIEQIQLDPNNIKEIEPTILDLSEMLTPSQYFLILPEGITAKGLTLYQMAQMGPHRKLKEQVNRAISKYPFGARP